MKEKKTEIEQKKQLNRGRKNKEDKMKERKTG
jgi:hypothetical protein